MKLGSTGALCVLACSACALSPVVHSSQLRTTPLLPLGLYTTLRTAELDSLASKSISLDSAHQHTFGAPPVPVSEAARLKSKYPAHTFDQQTSHDPNVPAEEGRETFQQRYWFDASYYREGGPVIFLNGGETDAEVRLPFLETGIVKILMEATGGVG